MHDELTAVDMQKMREELREREEVLMPKILEDVKVARSFGDLSENFEYHAAKKEKNKNESRIRYLERMLKNATVISDESQEGVVGLNKTIELYIEEMEEVQKFKLVTSVRCDSIEGKISIESPLGKAINGHREGDRVYVKVNENAGYYLEIRAIEKSDDEAEDSIRKY